MDRGAWQAMVHGVAKNQTQLSYYHTHTPFGLHFPGGSDGKESACSAGE